MFNKKDYKKVGQTELKVSPITLGTMTFGDQNSEKEAFEQLDYALAQGINSFDVAVVLEDAFVSIGFTSNFS